MGNILRNLLRKNRLLFILPVISNSLKSTYPIKNPDKTKNTSTPKSPPWKMTLSKDILLVHGYQQTFHELAQCKLITHKMAIALIPSKGFRFEGLRLKMERMQFGFKRSVLKKISRHLLVVDYLGTLWSISEYDGSISNMFFSFSIFIIINIEI